MQISKLLFVGHFQQPLLSNRKKTPALLRGQISRAPPLVELDGLLVVFCYDEMHAAAAGLRCGLRGRDRKSQRLWENHSTKCSWDTERTGGFTSLSTFRIWEPTPRPGETLNSSSRSGQWSVNHYSLAPQWNFLSSLTSKLLHHIEVLQVEKLSDPRVIGEVVHRKADYRIPWEMCTLS